MSRQVYLIALTLIGLTAWITTGALASTHDFFKGKTIRIAVGASAGGAFDTYGRIVGRHLGKHIPGSPVVLVENVTGAGGLILANQIYKTTKPDGLTIATFNGGLLMGEVLGGRASSLTRGNLSIWEYPQSSIPCARFPRQPELRASKDGKRQKPRSKWEEPLLDPIRSIFRESSRRCLICRPRSLPATKVSLKCDWRWTVAN